MSYWKEIATDLIFDDRNGECLSFPGWTTGKTHITDVQAQAILNAPVAAVVPETITPKQLEIGLLRAGKLDALLAIVEQLSREDQITYNKMQDVERNNPLTIQLAAALGMTSAEDLDAFFISSSKIL
jgi:hypothetical protein